MDFWKIHVYKHEFAKLGRSKYACECISAWIMRWLHMDLDHFKSKNDSKWLGQGGEICTLCSCEPQEICYKMCRSHL